MKPEDALAFVDAFAELVAEKVLARMQAPTTHYSTRKGATLPPGKSRAWALANLKTISGARKVGRDWVIAAEDYEAWVVKQDTARAARAAAGGKPGLRRGMPANDAPADIEELVEKSLAANGLRRAR